MATNCPGLKYNDIPLRIVFVFSSIFIFLAGFLLSWVIIFRNTLPTCSENGNASSGWLLPADSNGAALFTNPPLLLASDSLLSTLLYEAIK